MDCDAKHSFAMKHPCSTPACMRDTNVDRDPSVPALLRPCPPGPVVANPLLVALTPAEY